jgi:hypothetical protein
VIVVRNNLSGFPEKVKNAHCMRLIETLQRVAPPAQVVRVRHTCFEIDRVVLKSHW